MRTLTAIASLLALLASAPAEAFRQERKFDDPAWMGGGDGQSFTGARRGRGWHCSICHVPADDPPTFVLSSAPAGLLVDGEYEPGQRYVITVELARERRPGDPSLPPEIVRGNGFNAEFVAPASGEAAGSLDPCVQGNLCADAADRCDPDACGEGEPALTPVVQRIAGGTAVHANATESTSWSFAWTAPPAGTGDLSLHFAGVDGDSSQDHEGDAVAVARLDLREASGRSGAVWPVALALAAIGRRRRRS